MAQPVKPAFTVLRVELRFLHNRHLRPGATVLPQPGGQRLYVRQRCGKVQVGFAAARRAVAPRAQQRQQHMIHRVAEKRRGMAGGA